MTLRSAAWLALLLSLVTSAHAQDAESSVLAEEIVVVAKRWEDTIAGATASVAVIGRRDIERRQASHVDTLLREIPGVHVVRDGPAGQLSRLFLRGAASNQTLVVVDGIPQNDATTGGGYDLSDLGTAGIERIEILRGSYSVLYGSEAIGGVVHVTTRRGSGAPRGFARIEAGSFDTQREVFGASWGDDTHDAAVTIGNLRTHGERGDQRHRSSDVTARLGWRPREDLSFDLTLRGVDSRVESPFDFPLGTILPSDGNIERRRETLSAGLATAWDATEWLVVRGALSRLAVESGFRNGPDGLDLIDPDFTPGSGDEFTVRRNEFVSRNEQVDDRYRIEATAFLGDAFGWDRPADGGLDVEVTAGHEWIDEDSRSRNTSPDFGAATSTTTRRHDEIGTRAKFAQASLLVPHGVGLEGGVLTVGARRDRHDTFGSENSPFVGGRVTIAATETMLRASYGEGFRAPKPSELFDPFVGNAGLGAETSESVDVGLSQPFLDGDLQMGVTWFRLRVEDLIAFDSTATSASRPFGALVNLSRTQTEGTEWNAAWALGAGFRASGSYTRQNPRDRTTGENLPNRAQQHGSVGLSWGSKTVDIALTGTFSGRHHGQGGEFVYPEPRERREPGRRRVLDLTARWRATDAITVFGRIENLLDEDWVATPTSPAGPPLGVFVGVQVEF